MKQRVNIQAIAFDAYGTLCYIADPTHPFSELLAQANMTASKAIRLCMIHNLDLADLATYIAPTCSSNLANLAEKVQREVASVRLFSEVEPTLDQLRARGMKLGLISNLATPYAQPVYSLLGQRIDQYIWSFEVGAVKPEPAIFAALCQRLEVPPGQVLMVGDSLRADIEGAQSVGMYALHLARTAHKKPQQSIANLTEVVEWLNTH